ncbi:MAG: ATP-dependent zinc protease [Pirellulaceae bacterium]
MNHTDVSAFDGLAEEDLPIMGWREWISLPDLDLPRMKAKIDTGARSSSLHAFDINTFTRDDQVFVRFDVHPVQRSDRKSVTCEAKVHDVRHIRSSSGDTQERFVILTKVQWKNEVWPVELTLADRSEMGFRMLVGREAIRGRMLVNPGKSYFGGRPKRKKRKS